jgi:hypothetical protein
MTSINDTIDGAEEFHDPLEGLVEKTKTDPGAPFAPEVLEALAALQKDDRAAFEKLRMQLKKEAKCRVKALDEALIEGHGGSGHKPTQADILVGLAQAAELFHTADRTGFADIGINGHRETWPLRSKGFSLWLTCRFYEETGGAPSSEALKSARNTLEAKAQFNAPERVIHIRTAGADGRIYIDLCDETWRAVEIDSTGWRVIDNPPVRFRRTKGMLPLPIPVAGGSIKELRPYINVRPTVDGQPSFSDADFVLAVAWILAALRPRGPYPNLAPLGEQGTAKTTLATLLRMLIDPNVVKTRALPRDEHNLFVAANNVHVLPFDNVSYLPEWLSDAMCRQATGGGYSTRELYTDEDEILFNVVRPVILNGIEEIITKPDLAERSIPLTLVPIPENKRRPEEDLLAAFEADRPRILGALLDAMATGLRRLPEVRSRLKNLPRMADFAFWVTACETAFWEAGTFMNAYTANIAGAVETILHHNTVATAVRDFMAMQQPATTWTGTATELLELLGRVAGEKATKTKFWPTDGARLSGRLRRVATFLRKVGIEINLAQEGHQRTRTVTITLVDGQGTPEGEAASDAKTDGQRHETDGQHHETDGQHHRGEANGSGDSSVAEDAARRMSDEIIGEIANVYQEEAANRQRKNGTVDFDALDDWFCKGLVTLDKPIEFVTAVLQRVKKRLSA